MTDPQLLAALGAQPPAGVAELSEDAQRQLAELIMAARRAQADELDAAFDAVLKHVPFPFRALARRMLRG